MSAIYLWQLTACDTSDTTQLEPRNRMGKYPALRWLAAAVVATATVLLYECVCILHRLDCGARCTHVCFSFRRFTRIPSILVHNTLVYKD